MRITYLSTDPGVPYGGRKGASVHVAELVDALAGEGAEALALVSGVAADAAPSASGVVVEPLLPPGKGASVARRLAAEPRLADWLEQRLARFRPDILYERLALHTAAGSRAAARLGVPHFVELNAPLVDEARRYRALDEPEAAARLEREVLTRADLVLAVSAPLAQHARRLGARRVEVLPNAVAIERYAEPQRRHGRPVAVFTGRVRPWHGIETVAVAWRMLGDAAPPLVVAGEPGEAREALEEVGASLLGSIPHRQVPAVLAEADIGLAPYAREAPDYFSPLKLCEYMAAGLAVVAGDLPATRELAPEEQVLLVPRGDPHALAAAVARLAVDPRRRERMGRAARRLVAEEHTWRHRARQVMARASGRPLREPATEAVVAAGPHDDRGVRA